MCQHRFSGKQAELFLDLAAHARAATGCDDNGGQTGFGCGGHDLALSIAPLSPMPGGKSIGYRPILIGMVIPGITDTLPQKGRNGWQSCLCLGQYARNFSSRA
jgi:hypothetical protein